MRFKVGDVVTIHQDIEGYDNGIQQTVLIPAFSKGIVRDRYQEGGVYRVGFPILEGGAEFNCHINHLLLHPVESNLPRRAA
jgi:hypothetical protein